MLPNQIGDSGFIRSPNYPSAYPPDIKCVWWLKAKNKGRENLRSSTPSSCFYLVGRISMTCTDVRTQSCDAGYFDYILVSLKIYRQLSTALEISFNITFPFIFHPSIFRLLQIGVGRNTIYSVAITTSQCHHLNQCHLLSNYHKSTNLKVHSIHVDVD